MACELVTGMAGKLHVTSAQAAAFNQAIAGKETCLLDTKKHLAASIQTANQVRLQPGDFLIQGRHVTCESVTDLSIESGSQGLNRIDLIVARYTKDARTGIESVALRIVAGTPALEPKAPDVTTGVIDEGALVAEFLLYSVYIQELTPQEPVRLIGLHNYELASGVTNGWTWIKYANGRAECHRSWNSQKVALDKKYGAFYNSGQNLYPPDYPFAFIEAPWVEYTPVKSEEDLANTVGLIREPSRSTTRPPYVDFLRAFAESKKSSYTLVINVKGRWK